MTKVKLFHRSLFYLLILLLPTQLTRHFWPDFAFVNGLRVDYLAPTIYLTDILIFLILSIWLLDLLKNKKLLKLLKIPKIFFFLILYTTLNIFLANSPIIALLKWVKLAQMGLLALYIIKTKPSLLLTCYLLLVTSLLSVLLAWAQFINNGALGGILYFLGERNFTISTPGIARQSFFGREFLRPYATFPHPNVLAGFLTATLPLILNLAAAIKKTTNLIARTTKFVVFLFTIIVTIWISTIFITGSLTALLVSLGIIFLYINKKQKKVLIVLLLALMIAVFANHDLRFTIYDLQNSSITRRLELSIAALQMFKTSPIFGIGLNNFIVRLPEFYRITEPIFFLQPVHNIYLLIMAEGGIVGFIMFLYLLLKIIKPLIFNFQIPIFNQILNSKSQTIKKVPVATGALLFLGIFDHYLLTLQQGLLLLAIILSFAHLYQQKKLPDSGCDLLSRPLAR